MIGKLRKIRRIGQTTKTGARDRERGAAIVEYVLVVALFALVSAGAINAFAGAIESQLVSFAGGVTTTTLADDDGTLPDDDPPPSTTTTTTLPPPPSTTTTTMPPATTTTTTTTTLPPPTTTTTVSVEPVVQTFDAGSAGSVTVGVTDDSLTLEDVDANRYWSWTVLVETDGKIVIRFWRGWQTVTITIVLEDGAAHATVS